MSTGNENKVVAEERASGPQTAGLPANNAPETDIDTPGTHAAPTPGMVAEATEENRSASADTIIAKLDVYFAKLGGA